MPILIDGYNLLHVSGVFGRGRGPGDFHRARQALLWRLAESIDDAQRPRTTIVFDAAEAPPGLPRTVAFETMTVRYASDHAEADDLIEELIQADHAPRKLVVVSSDHRIQRAARRRRAKAIDSGPWFAQLMSDRARRGQSSESLPAKPDTPPSASEVQYWLEAFADAADVQREWDAAGRQQAPRGKPAPRRPSPDSRPRDAKELDAGDLDNPFPPGYGEDLL